MFLQIWSRFAVSLYLTKVQKGITQEECMPTQVMENNRFISDMQKLSGLPINIITEIVKRLTYRQGGKSNLLLQPFVVVKETILWSPVLVSKLRYKRNILKDIVEKLCKIDNNFPPVGHRQIVIKLL